VYVSKAPEAVSWFQAWPQPSLRLLSSVAAPRSAVLDVGAGTSTLTDALLGAGWSDVTVLDVSAEALAVVRARLGARQHQVSFVVGDVLSWQPERTYEVWHDRAVFHFLVQPDERARYLATARRAVVMDGAVVIGAFAVDGPRQCSGLPTARYSADQLADAFAPAFKLAHAEREEHRTPDGVVQPFTWVVLRRPSSRGQAVAARNA
jgi:ubiquinone/menaquinone biosynthesis C-methylase UbiE